MYKELDQRYHVLSHSELHKLLLLLCVRECALAIYGTVDGGS